MSKATVTSVADRFGARHHSTVIHARDRLKDLISVHEYTRNEVEWLKMRYITLTYQSNSYALRKSERYSHFNLRETGSKL
ncbi:hypothetical protein [Paraflavitalea speifideaquila]|uniref:hypothetical protein n=1 Tax=Paraflavitalea speifideaquila TaxID=3076558 RepID=UPI003312FCE6